MWPSVQPHPSRIPLVWKISSSVGQSRKLPVSTGLVKSYLTLTFTKTLLLFDGDDSSALLAARLLGSLCLSALWTSSCWSCTNKEVSSCLHTWASYIYACCNPWRLTGLGPPDQRLIGTKSYRSMMEASNSVSCIWVSLWRTEERHSEDYDDAPNEEHMSVCGTRN